MVLHANTYGTSETNEIISSQNLMPHLKKNLSWFIAGTLFAILWASASTATKIGLAVAQPLVIAEVRFALASFIMLFITHFILKQGLP
jgi:drug/metabolite transporter (DMT)-like permease